jgi:predicted component of viral defense system (DUF524 family)
MKFAAFVYKTASFQLKVFPAGKNRLVCWDDIKYTDGCFDFFSLVDDDPNGKSYVEYEKNEAYNIEPLRLKETIRYKCIVEPINTDEKTICVLSLKNEDNKFLKIERDDERSLVFQFINYLGKSKLFFDESKTGIPFEVVPDKISYDVDYINLTNSIAEECAALLLDYSSPTSHTFSQDWQKQYDTPLEQFIFLRQFCLSENLDSLFASIKRNPDRKLVCEDELKPFGTGKISKRFYTNPFSAARGWTEVDEDYFLPSEIAITRKYDSFDTPANRFIKFALNSFLDICEKIEQHVSSSAVYLDEARMVKERIEDVLQDSFFDDVMDLTIMPSNNQVLEKREGYAQIFNAFSMVDLALKLDWKGKDDVYSGEAKNTALLYEYWLFFELRKIIKEIEGCKRIEGDDGIKSIVTDKDGLSIVLQQGTKSVERFEIANFKVFLYYNYTFEPQKFRNTKYEGSYSRPFRPDYTIAIFPKIFKNEHEAIKAGEVHYIHFDAKYRLDDLSLFRNTGEIDTSKINKEVSEEKNESVTNTYKRGDLLKMHTYNDAIRNTIGSFVLYPGTSNEGKPPFSVYEEVLPGVGAFAIRPGDINDQNLNVGEQDLKIFIKSIVEFNANPASRNARMEYFNKIISESPSEIMSVEPLNGDSDLYMLGFLRKEYHDWLLEKHFIPKAADDDQYKAPDAGIYFYYHAIRDGYVYPQHKNITNAKYFCARCRNDYGKENNVAQFDLDPWIAEVESTKLVSAEQLAHYLKEMNGGDGFEQEEKFSAEYYYLVELKNIQLASLSKDSFVSKDSGNLAISAYSPKIAQRVK